MELQFLNKKLELVGIVDIATSIQWRERYYEVGTFEIQIPMYDELRTILHNSFFIVHPESEYTGVIEHYDSLDSTEEGQYITVLGRFAECLLSYRISRYIRNYSNMKVSEIITNLLNENVFYPVLQEDEIARGLTVSPRKITSIYETVINELTTDMQVSLSTSFEDNLLEVILGLLSQINGSIKLVLEDDKFYLVLFTGIDRREYVRFSKEFDNLLSANYVVDNTESANAIYVGGEEQEFIPGNGGKRPEGRLIWKYEEPKNGDVVSDLDRKELFVDADDVKQEIKNENDVTTKILTEAEYKSVLYTRAKESRVYPTEEISTEIDTLTYEYRVDYNLGDLISIEDSLGKFDRQIVGIDRVDEETSSITPIFDTIPNVTYPEQYEEENDVPSLLTERGVMMATENGRALSTEDNTSVKISELDSVTSLNSTDIIPVVASGETKKVSYSVLIGQLLNEVKDEIPTDYLTQDYADNTYLTINNASSTYLTKTSASSTYALKTDLDSYASKSALSNYATKSELGNYVTKTAAALFVTHSDMEEYVDNAIPTVPSVPTYYMHTISITAVSTGTKVNVAFMVISKSSASFTVSSLYGLYANKAFAASGYYGTNTVSKLAFTSSTQARFVYGSTASTTVEYISTLSDTVIQIV